jgi:lipid II:glycine glycyltransferase (peptidoglycan interpeptide bridge formation enzyme)
LTEERQQVAAEKARVEADATEAAHRTKEQAEERQRWAEVQRQEHEHEQEQERQAAQEQVLAEKARLEAEAASVSATVYSTPTAYVAPTVTYYYATPVRYYYVVTRPPQIVRWGYQPTGRAPFVPVYRYAAGYSPSYRQGRFGR